MAKEVKLKNGRMSGDADYDENSIYLIDEPQRNLADSESDKPAVDEVGGGDTVGDGVVFKRERNRKSKNADGQQMNQPSSKVNGGRLRSGAYGESAEAELREQIPTVRQSSSIIQHTPSIPPHLTSSHTPFQDQGPPFNSSSLPSLHFNPSNVLAPPSVSHSLGNVPSLIGNDRSSQSSTSSRILTAPAAVSHSQKVPMSICASAMPVLKQDSSSPISNKVVCANSPRVSASENDSLKPTLRHGCCNDVGGEKAAFDSEASSETDAISEDPYEGAVGPNLDFPDHLRRISDTSSSLSMDPGPRFPADVRLRPRLEKRWSDPDRVSPARVVASTTSYSPDHRKSTGPINNNAMSVSSAALPSTSSSPCSTARVKNQSPLSPANVSASIAAEGSPNRLSPAPDDPVSRRGFGAKSAISNRASNVSSPASGPSFHPGNEAQNRSASSVSGREANLNNPQQPRRRAPQLSLEDGAVGGEVGQPSQEQQHHQQVQQQQHYNWQSSKSTVKERLCFMFNNETMADVHFKVGKGTNVQNIPAHKFVLSIGSAVFDAMFNGYMATKQTEIELPDVEPTAFLATLRFLYTDEVTIGPETVMTTLYAAKKYAVPALESNCVDFLKKNLSPDNSFMLLTQARLFDEPQLAALCLETIDKNTQEAVSAEGFCDVDLETLCVVLERDSLGIREAKLFNAVAKWSEAECNRRNIPLISENKRQVLGRALHLIRFPLMNIEEFASGPAQSGLLIDPEVVSLFLYFTVNPKPNVLFADVPRCCLTGKEQVVNRFCQTESRWGYSGTSDRLRFMVNRKIFIVGFGLYGSIHGATEYAVNMQITHTDSSRIVGQNETSFPCDGTNATFRVMFKEPVEIYPNMNYTAACTLKGPDSYYGTKGQRKVVHESISRERVVFTFSYAAGSNNGTSVEDGQIPEIIFYT